jgi:hypothetical protein
MAKLEKMCARGVFDPPATAVGSLSHPDHMIELEAIAVI